MTTANAQLLDYIAKHTGWNRSIESASYLADNILEMVSSFVSLQIMHFYIGMLIVFIYCYALLSLYSLFLAGME